MCPSVVLKTLTIPMDPKDSRWAELYQACLSNYGSWIYPEECRQLCTDVANTSSVLTNSQGINECSLDCSKPQSPSLTIEYSETRCS